MAVCTLDLLRYHSSIAELTDYARPYFFIEKAGRRNVLISSAGACSFCMVMIAVMLRIGTVVVHMSPLRFNFFVS